MAKSMNSMLAGATSKVAPSKVTVVERKSDLERILALPRRAPMDCQRDPRTKKFQPATQAVIEVMTAKYSRGPRLSCGCRPRKVVAQAEGQFAVFRILPEGPQPAQLFQRDAFIEDNRHALKVSNRTDVLTQLEELKPGQQLDLPSADGSLNGHPCIDLLNPVQAWTLKEAAEVGGIVGFKGVGSGKTVTGLLIPLVFPETNVAVLIIEPKQRKHYRSHYLRLLEHFRTTTIRFDDGKTGYTVLGTTPLHLISFSTLSRPNSSAMLDQQLKPTIVIIDEAHRACGDSAINRRVKWYFASRIKLREIAMAKGEAVRSRAVHVFDWSGTMEPESVENTHMLSSYSLGTGSPLPLNRDEMQLWSKVMDESYQPDDSSKTANALYDAFGGAPVTRDPNGISLAGGSSFQEAIRRGFRNRRLETRGVISASAEGVNAAIYFSEREAPPIPSSVRDALAMVRSKSLRPDGEELTERIQQVSCARNLACGFYAYWAFPEHPCTCPADSELSGKRCKDCTLIYNWYEKRKLFNKELRSKLLRGQPNLDSEKLCRDAAERFAQGYKGDLPVWECESWPAWRDIENKVKYVERVKWVDEFLAKDAAEWALENKGVVWFQSVALGRKISELTGLPYFNGGPKGEERLLAEKGDRSIIVSLDAHGSGTDGLQYLFNRQLIVEMPASNGSGKKGMEQVMGRMHRRGQKADEVFYEAYLHVSELKDCLRNAISEAQFNYQMTGNLQKLLLADIDVDGL